MHRTCYRRIGNKILKSNFVGNSSLHNDKACRSHLRKRKQLPLVLKTVPPPPLEWSQSSSEMKSVYTVYISRECYPPLARWPAWQAFKGEGRGENLEALI